MSGGGAMKETRIIRVEVRNKILGDSVFWEGPSKDVCTIRNVPARMLAEKVAIDGVTRVSGMWHVSVLPAA